MKRRTVFTAIIAVFVLTILAVAVFVATPLVEAQWRMRQGERLPKYDPATEVTLDATVEEVKQQTGRRGATGTHLIVKTDSGMLEVHVGPSSFLASKNISFVKGDRIRITGSKVTREGAEALIAREIKKGDSRLVLRDAKGFPVWSRRNAGANARP
jgi:hypothetical protein